MVVSSPLDKLVVISDSIAIAHPMPVRAGIGLRAPPRLMMDLTLLNA